MITAHEKAYKPIDCGLYSQYEEYILYRQKLKIKWQDNWGAYHLEILSPKDLQTKYRAEYLVAETPNGKLIEIRLDQIISTVPEN